MSGSAVQLVGGKERVLDAGDPRVIAEEFKLAGEVAVIDLDAALGQGTNESVIRDLLAMAPCRVGGGIRSVAAAIKWLDAGAEKIILGTAAKPEILKQLPTARVMAALDAENGEIVVEGWRTKTGAELCAKITELKPYVASFLVTFVESEGRLNGIDLARVKEVVEAAAPRRVTVAGGVTTVEEVAAIDRLGADAQVGMALYTKRFSLGAAIAAPLVSDRPDGLFPTVVCDELGKALGLCYSSVESIDQAVRTRCGVYCSRKRGLWVKGESSGATQELLRVSLDCDRDALRFIVKQKAPGFCHNNTYTCFGPDSGLSALMSTLQGRIASEADPASYTRRLIADRSLLRAKLVEEAGELADAQTQAEVVWEAADVLYFTLVRMAGSGVTISDVERELHRRSLKLTRRPGNAKS